MLPNELFCLLASFDSVAVVRLARCYNALWRALENYAPLWRVVFQTWPTPLYKSRPFLITKWPSAHCVPELIAENVHSIRVADDGTVAYNIGREMYVEQRAIGRGLVMRVSDAGRYVVYHSGRITYFMNVETRGSQVSPFGCKFIRDTMVSVDDDIRPVDLETGQVETAWPDSTNTLKVTVGLAGVYTWHRDGWLCERGFDGTIRRTIPDGRQWSYIRIGDCFRNRETKTWARWTDDGLQPVILPAWPQWRDGRLHWRGRSVAMPVPGNRLFVSDDVIVYGVPNRENPRAPGHWLSLFRWRLS